jgi:hypothetical protein
MEDDIHGDETIREVLDRHPPHASREELAKLELRFRDLELRVERLERSERIAFEAIEISGR